MLTAQLPAALVEILRGYDAQRVTIGESPADVHRLTADGRPTLVLKTQPRDPLFSLWDEALRLRWLQGRAPVPKVLEFVEDRTHDYLLMRALPGHDATAADLPPDRLVEILADGLRQLHAIPAEGCPFRYRVDDCLALSGAALAAGRVDVTDFDDAFRGRDPFDLYRELVRSRPTDGELVFTHGDYCLPNVIVDGGLLSGFVDLGRAGLADPYRDLALACRSLRSNHGEEWSARFFARYGIEQPDRERLHFYTLLDEFL